MMIGAFDLPRVRALAEQFLGWGVRCLKVKVGLDLAGDLARVQAVRELAGPDIPITVDANCGWNVTTARIALEQLRPFNLLVAEQPIAPGDTEAMASLRSAGGIPIMADESVFTLADAWNVLRAHAADVISIYPGKNGGIAASIEIAHVAAGRRNPLPCRQQPRAGHRLGGHAAPGLRGPEHRQRDLPGRHPRPALPRERPAHGAADSLDFAGPACRMARAWA